MATATGVAIKDCLISNPFTSCLNTAQSIKPPQESMSSATKFPNLLSGYDHSVSYLCSSCPVTSQWRLCRLPCSGMRQHVGWAKWDGGSMILWNVGTFLPGVWHNFAEGTLQEHWMEQVLYFLIPK